MFHAEGTAYIEVQSHEKAVWCTRGMVGRAEQLAVLKAGLQQVKTESSTGSWACHSGERQSLSQALPSASVCSQGLGFKFSLSLISWVTLSKLFNISVP